MPITRPSRNAVTGAALACAVLAGTAFATSATAAEDPIPVRPDMSFHGLVNGHAGSASILVGCFGPIFPGKTGHPLAGQTVEADSTPPGTTADGYTGSAAKSLVVTFSSSPSGSILVIGTLINFYQPVPIPTSLDLPCSGVAQVGFTPEPTSPTARPSAVKVSLIGQP
jgi:hypothetical protein